MPTPGFGHTVAVFDQSGKVLSTGKTLFSVFNEAKAAYKERKAEILIRRRTEQDVRHVRRSFQSFGFDEGRPAPSSRHSHHGKSRSRPKHRSREHSGSQAGSDLCEANLAAHTSAPTAHRRELPRRHTTHGDSQLTLQRHTRRPPSFDDSQIDLDLAYGDEMSLPSPRGLRAPEFSQEVQLTGLMSRASFLLDEAHCVQHSVTQMIASLQKNPDALAAVALTLAEISNLANKMGPGALMALRSSFPRVVGLLASPQFLIAAGVGVGVLVIAIGGYKIVQKLQARQGDEAADLAELQEIGSDPTRIDAWRRGVSESDAGTVEAEFITPEAAALRWNAREADRRGVHAPYATTVDDTEIDPDEERRHRRRMKRQLSAGDALDGRSSVHGTTPRDSSHPHRDTSDRKSGKGGSKKRPSKKRESTLQLLFR
ncbi:MAG: hypothetical protein M1825_000556 [Sarcosagium campestre]|nr:MAG: hypothetical protein M1825_000556 [Sarcosagium campestre]